MQIRWLVFLACPILTEILILFMGNSIRLIVQQGFHYSLQQWRQLANKEQI